MKPLGFIGLLGLVFYGSAATAETDFGIRTVAPSTAVGIAPSSTQSHPQVGLNRAVSIGSRFGVVTSTRRSAGHNRRVGGVPNSYHLTGRAIDIARRPGVSHTQIAQAYRQAGMELIESLDEGDHSHFAFRAARLAAVPVVRSSQGTNWRIVLAP